MKYNTLLSTKIVTYLVRGSPYYPISAGVPKGRLLAFSSLLGIPNRFPQNPNTIIASFAVVTPTLSSNLYPTTIAYNEQQHLTESQQRTRKWNIIIKKGRAPKLL